MMALSRSNSKWPQGHFHRQNLKSLRLARRKLLRFGKNPRILMERLKQPPRQKIVKGERRWGLMRQGRIFDPFPSLYFNLRRPQLFWVTEIESKKHTKLRYAKSAAKTDTPLIFCSS